jgi:putative nucleotidyltransferase with HDIG domain
LGSTDAQSTSATVFADHEKERVQAERCTWYVGFVCLGAVLFLCYLVYFQFNSPLFPALYTASTLLVFMFLLAMAFVAERYKIVLGNGIELSAGFLADFLGATLVGPLAGAVTAAVVVTQLRRGQESKSSFFWHAAFFASVGVVAVGSAGLVFWQIRGTDPSAWRIVVGGVAGGLVHQVVNYLLITPVGWWRRGMTPGDVFRDVFEPFLPFHFFFLALSVSLIYAFNQSRWLFGVFALPVLGLVYALRTFANQRELTRSLERFSMQIAASMIDALDLKDNYTARHSGQVAQYAYDIAHAMGFSSRDCSLAHLAGLLHDLGKISVPDEILGKRQALADDEWSVVMGHSLAGQKILGNMNEFEELSLIVLYHHEHYDGSGYPDGIHGDRIPIFSRVVSVADCYSAMISDRPYRKRLSPDVAMAELVRESGRQFDPEVVSHFLRLLESGDEDYRLAQHIDFHVQFQKVRFLRDFA